MLTIAPYKRSGWLAKVFPDELKFLHKVSWDYRAPCAAWADGLVFLYRGNKTLSLRYVTEQQEKPEREWPLAEYLPIDFSWARLAIVGNRVYVSGVFEPGNNSPALITASLLEDQPIWTDCYPDALLHRKEIDALMAQDGRLIAVDNIVMPKFMFVIEDAASPSSPARVFQLRDHGTYERVLGATLCQGRLAVLSHTTGEYGGGMHVALIDLETFHESSCLTASYTDETRNEDESETVPVKPKTVAEALGGICFGPNNLATCAGRVIVACGRYGIAIINPEHIDAKINFTDADELAVRSIARAVALDELPLQRGREQGGAAEPQRVVDVIGAGDAGCVAVVSYSDNSHESILLTNDFVTILAP